MLDVDVLTAKVGLCATRRAPGDISHVRFKCGFQGLDGGHIDRSGLAYRNIDHVPDLYMSFYFIQRVKAI